MKNVIIQTDFGTGSLSVSAMHGVCKMVDNNLSVNDGNNDVNQFDVLDASSSLLSTEVLICFPPMFKEMALRPSGGNA